jgi:hypothetical protein
VKVRADLANDRPHIFFLEYDNCVYGGERGEQFRAFFGGNQRASFALQRTDRIITVHRDYKFAAQFMGCLKVANVANMQQVETAVRQRDAITAAAPF